MGAIEDGWLSADATRELQEREIALSHELSDVEHALSVEARAVSHLFAEAGVQFDLLTVVSLRIVNECFEMQVDPVVVLSDFMRRGVLRRAVDLAEETGGRHFPVGNLNELPDIAAKIGIELRNQYVLGYAPSNAARRFWWGARWENGRPARSVAVGHDAHGQR